jgi:hypothetical protein
MPDTPDDPHYAENALASLAALPHNSTGDGTRKHLHADAHVSRTSRICLEQRLIGLPAFRLEKIMHAA